VQESKKQIKDGAADEGTSKKASQNTKDLALKLKVTFMF
jgi:hypothetical protein